MILRETAKEFHLPNVDTGDTYRSIQSSPVVPLPGGGSVNVFVTTPYSKFLEFGFVHHLTGQWIFNPFMLPAADLVVPEFVNAVSQVANIVGSQRFLTGLAAQSPANDLLQSARSALYSYSKYAGDIQVLGVGGLSGSRGLALKGARGIGNIQAARQGTIVARATRVVTGKFAGRFGRSGFTSGFSPGSLFTGPSARIYNRLSGRLFGGQLSRIGRF